MGHIIPDKAGITINGKDITELNPDQVKDWIGSLSVDEKQIVISLLKSKMYNTPFPLEDNYAEHAGRPSLTELPFMQSENDGMPYLKGHSPACDGKKVYYHKGQNPLYNSRSSAKGMCWCEWIGYKKKVV